MDEPLFHLVLTRFYLPVGVVMVLVIWIRPFEEIIGLLALVPFLIVVLVWLYIFYLSFSQGGETSTASQNAIFGFIASLWIMLFGLLHFAICGIVYYLFKEFGLFEKVS